MVPKPEEEVIFHVARRLGAAEGAAYLQRACGADRVLHSRLAALLRIHDSDDGFLDAPAEELAAALDTPNDEPTQLDDDTIGPYRLLEPLGDGGFGRVFRAERDGAFFAIKVLKPGLMSRAARARFEVERAALALMDHPHIARVFDSGMLADGRPYFVMDVLRGQPITLACRQQNIPPRGRIALAIDVCAAVQHAHQKGIVHRDIKPSNVLLTDHGQVKVIDFGVAKALGPAILPHPSLTGVGQVVGTPLAMAPEQMDFDGPDVDTRADLYALGVLLYELLTDTLPFDPARLASVGFDELRRIIRDEEPPRPSARTPLPADLDWIVMKCLEKDRARRYATAGDLARDLERYLNDEPVEARPPSRGYRVRKFLRRHRTAVMATSLVAMTLVAGVVGTTWGLLRANEARAAEAKRAEAEQAAKEQALTAERDARRHEADAVAQLHRANDLTDFLENDLLSQAGSRSQARLYEPNPQLTVREALERASDTVGTRFRDRPELEAHFRDTIGRAFVDVGAYDKAVTEFRRAVDLETKRLGPEHRNTLKLRQRLGDALRLSARFPQATSELDKTYAIAVRTLGADDPQCITTANSLAMALMTNLRGGDGVKLLRETEARCLRLWGDAHPLTRSTRTNLGYGLIKSGMYLDAIEVFKALKAGYESTQGIAHPATLQAMSHLADAYAGAKQWVLALDHFHRLVDLMDQVYGPDHPTALDAHERRAAALADSGAGHDAVCCLLDLAARRERLHGPKQSDVVRTKALLGRTYAKMGDTTAAIETLTAVLPLNRALYGYTHWTTREIEANLGIVYYDARRLREAVPYLEAAHRGGDRDPKIHLVSERLFRATKVSDPERAAEVVCEIVARERTRLKDKPAFLANSLFANAERLEELQQFADAEALMRESVKRLEQTGSNDSLLHFYRSYLGNLMTRQKKFDDAEPLLSQSWMALSVLDDRGQGLEHHKQAALRNLMLHAAAQGRLPEAECWRWEIQQRLRTLPRKPMTSVRGDAAK